MRIGIQFIIVLFLSFNRIFPQDTVSGVSDNSTPHNTTIGGFIRGGFYTWADRKANKLYIPDAFSDVGIKFETGNGNNFSALADLRYRYGSQFSEPVSLFDLKEGYIKVFGKEWNFTAGQRIVKWGRGDFTNPTLKLSPRDLLFRSPDREDMDLGNILASAQWFPSPYTSIEAILIPFYRPSTLIIDPVPLPAGVTINKIQSLLTESKYTSYALKADLHIKGLDLSLSWFNGYDPMPGIALEKFNLDLNQSIPTASTELSVKPYRTRVAGADFETTAGNFGLRGEAAWSIPCSSTDPNEFIPFPEIKWVAGLDWFSENWHIIGEYSGKYITKFSTTSVKPLMGTQPDYPQLALLISDPGFDLNEYVRQQVAACNRLYNYQLERYYHTIACRIEADLGRGKIAPSVFSSFNLTSGDLLIIPEVKYKPADGLSVTAGVELYSGRKGSLFDLINEFMNGFYLSIRTDF